MVVRITGFNKLRVWHVIIDGVIVLKLVYSPFDNDFWIFNDEMDVLFSI